MKLNIVVVIGLVALLHALSIAQGGKDIKGIPPGLLLKSKRASEISDQGRAFLAKGEINRAITAFRQVVEIEDTYDHFTSSGNYELAKAFTQAGRNTEALGAYKKAFRWDARIKDIISNGPSAILITMDYATLLAKCGKEVEAKALYYRGLRVFNQQASKDFEAVPFLVVFDPDPDMIVWKYSSERLIATALMARAPFMDTDGKIAAEEVRRMEPNWIVPVTYLASIYIGSKRAELIRKAQGLAENADERQWVTAFAQGLSLAELGHRLRKGSALLQQARLDLEKTHAKVAG